MLPLKTRGKTMCTGDVSASYAVNCFRHEFSWNNHYWWYIIYYLSRQCNKKSFLKNKWSFASYPLCVKQLQRLFQGAASYFLSTLFSLSNWYFVWQFTIFQGYINMSLHIDERVTEVVLCSRPSTDMGPLLFTVPLRDCIPLSHSGVRMYDLGWLLMYWVQTKNNIHFNRSTEVTGPYGRLQLELEYSRVAVPFKRTYSSEPTFILNAQSFPSSQN